VRRLIDNRLEQWRNKERRKPLVLRGARQVGKTYSVRALANHHFDQLLMIDFERNPDIRRLFDQDLDPDRLLSELELITGVRAIPGKTLIFFDEIQTCPRALVALRYFKEQRPDLHLIAAGSLIDFTLRDLSFPVGRVQFLEMLPMTFGEFLWARKRDDAAAVVLDGPTAVTPTVHSFLLGELATYLKVGGLPEAVAAFVATGSMLESREVQDELLTSYWADFSKYAPRADKACLRAVMASVAGSVGQQIKYTRLSRDFANVTVKRAFDLLTMARVATRIPAASPAGLPLAGHASDKIFKALFLDVGLMHRAAGLDPATHYSPEGLLAIHRGAVAEQFVGQELAAATNRELYYWARPVRGSSAEVDYLIAKGDTPLPIEVKSGSTGRLRSLAQLMLEYPTIKRALLFSTAPAAPPNDNGIERLPLYAAYNAAVTT
jgi:uncharacterized protein